MMNRCSVLSAVYNHLCQVCLCQQHLALFLKRCVTPSALLTLAPGVSCKAFCLLCAVLRRRVTCCAIRPGPAWPGLMPDGRVFLARTHFRRADALSPRGRGSSARTRHPRTDTPSPCTWTRFHLARTFLPRADALSSHGRAFHVQTRLPCADAPFPLRRARSGRAFPARTCFPCAEAPSPGGRAFPTWTCLPRAHAPSPRRRPSLRRARASPRPRKAAIEEMCRRGQKQERGARERRERGVRERGARGRRARGEGVAGRGGARWGERSWPTCNTRVAPRPAASLASRIPASPSHFLVPLPRPDPPSAPPRLAPPCPPSPCPELRSSRVLSGAPRSST